MAMKRTCRMIVKPAEGTWNGIIPLTELDHISVITHASQVYFYDKPTSHQQELCNNVHQVTTIYNVFDTLRESLSRALVPFYPLAGRLRWIGRGRMELVCNAMGAELIEVESTMRLADFGDFYSSSDRFEDLCVELDYYRTPIEELPLLAVQLTRFACGGLSVGISNSHVVVDGRSAFHFIREWARLARGEPLEVVPALDRRALQASGRVTRALGHRGDLPENNRNYFFNMEKGKRATPTFVLLTKDAIQQLKEDANSEINGCTYNRFEVIGAHVWRCVCKARELDGDATTTFNFLVDVRTRMDPPSPSSYYGNAVVTPNVSSNVGELISKPLSYGCSKIREASTKVTSEYVLDYIEHLKNEESLIKYQYIEDRGKIQGPSCGDHDVIAISWLNLVARGVDFEWGNEVYVGPPMVYGCEGDVMIIPYNMDDGSVLVAVFLQPKQNQMFQKYMSSLPNFKTSRL